MEDDQGTDDVTAKQLTFNHQELEEKITPVIEEVLADKAFDEDKVQHWINEICERIVKNLYDARKPFKYMVSCLIMQKTEAGLQTSTACNYEVNSDLTFQYIWPKEKAKEPANKTLHCILTVFCTRF